MVASFCGYPNSPMTQQIQISFWQANEAAIYSASVADKATVACLFEVQEINPPVI